MISYKQYCLCEWSLCGQGSSKEVLSPQEDRTNLFNNIFLFTVSSSGPKSTLGPGPIGPKLTKGPGPIGP